MIVCPKCNAQLAESAKFCENCGAPVGQTPGQQVQAKQAVNCPKCGSQAEVGFKFCEVCGTPLADNARPLTENAKPMVASTRPPVSNANTQIMQLKMQPVKKSVRKWPIFAGAGVLAIAVIVLAVVLLGGNSYYGLFLKDNEIFCTDFSKDQPWQLSSGFLRIILDEFSNEDVEVLYRKLANDGGHLFGLYIQRSKDNKIIFYPDRLDMETGLSLYYRHMNKRDQEPVKIDSSVFSYTVNNDANLVTYLKWPLDTDAMLYQYDMRTDTKEKIGENVLNYKVTDDGRKLCYINAEGNIYIKHYGKDKEKIESYAAKLAYVSEDLKTIYYIKEGSLYRKVEGKDKEKIASNVNEVLKVYESGELYFVRLDFTDVALINYVVDDMKDIDAAMTEPVKPVYPSMWDYETWEEYDAAVDRYWEEYEEYEEALEMYQAKLDRDYLRESLAERTLWQYDYTLLYYYNGTEEKLVADAFYNDTYYGPDYSGVYFAADSPVVVYSRYNQSTFDKVKLSEISSAYDVEEMVEAALYSSTEKYIAIKDTASILDQESAKAIMIADDGRTIYYIDNVAEGKDTGDLYRIVVSGGKLKEPELYDSYVCVKYVSMLADGKLLYFKDVKNYKGDLYIDKKRIDYDVDVYRYVYNADSKKLVYFVDYNNNKEYGTLKVFENGKAVKIADDVFCFEIAPDGRILYLCDYSMVRHMGDLYSYNNGKSTKIDDDVLGIIRFDDRKYKGNDPEDPDW